MPNLDAPNGFEPNRHLHGGTVRYNGGYKIESTLASDIFLGDVVRLVSPLDNNRIDVAAAGDAPLLGVFAGAQYTDANGDVRWVKQWVSGTTTLGGVDAEAFVYTDPNIIYTVQVDGTIAATDIGNFSDLVAGAGNTANGISGFELNATTSATTAQFRIIGLATQPEGIFQADLSAANPRVEVQFNEHVQIGNLLGAP